MSARVEQVASAEINTWLIGDDDEVIVIDPGHDPARVLDAVGDREVLAVICTHGQPGLIAGALEVARRDEAPVAVHPLDRTGCADVPRPTDPAAGAATEAELEMADGGMFETAGVSLEVIHTPGYTAGSVCLYCEDLGLVFTGHALAAGGPVPLDGAFPDFAGQLTAIGEALLTLPGDTRVLPGLGQETTIARAEQDFDSWAIASPETPGGPG
jgi:glyoxylase-like metal-dependent hydrolase (beta-lactamase superfamily II)